MEMSKPDPARPEVVNRRLVLENLKFHIFFDHIRDALGSEVENYLVVAPKIRTEELVTGIAVAPVVSRKLGLLRFYRHAVSRMSWEIPRGFFDPGETESKNAALRELEEECGLTASNENFLELGFLAPEAGTLAARVALYAALDCEIRPELKLPELGRMDLQFFDRSEISSLIAAGKIEDPYTLVAYYSLAERGNI